MCCEAREWLIYLLPEAFETVCVVRHREVCD